MSKNRQSIMRNRLVTHFVQVGNALARDKELSHAAKGLLLQMLSYPDDWVFSLKHLASNSKSGLHATRSAFNELQERGYVTRELKRSDGGHLLGYDYSVYGEPTVVRFSDDGKTDDGKPHATNTDLTNTESTNSKRIVDAEAEPRPARQSATPTTLSEIEAIVQAWNDNRGTLPEITVLSETRKRKLRALIKEHNGQAIDLIRDATRQVAQNTFWQENRYTLDNLLAGDKYLAHAEAHRETNQQNTQRKHRKIEVPF